MEQLACMNEPPGGVGSVSKSSSSVLLRSGFGSECAEVVSE